MHACACTCLRHVPALQDVGIANELLDRFNPQASLMRETYALLQRAEAMLGHNADYTGTYICALFTCFVRTWLGLACFFFFFLDRQGN